MVYKRQLYTIATNSESVFAHHTKRVTKDKHAVLPAIQIRNVRKLVVLVILHRLAQHFLLYLPRQPSPLRRSTATRRFHASDGRASRAQDVPAARCSAVRNAAIVITNINTRTSYETVCC